MTVATGTRTLEEIASMVGREYVSFQQAQQQGFDHIIAIGHALIEAEDQCGRGFVKWFGSNVMNFTYKTGLRYMRIAENEDLIREQGMTSINSAWRFLRSQGLLQKGSKWNARTKARAVKLLAEGVSVRQISYELSVPETTIYNWKGGPGALARKARSLAYNRKLQDDRMLLQHAAVEAAGEGVAAAYDLLAMLRTLVDGLTEDDSPVVRNAAIPLSYAMAKAMNNIANECTRRQNELDA